MDDIKSIAVPVTRKRATAAKPRRAGRPTPPADAHIGGTVGEVRRRPAASFDGGGKHQFRLGERVRMAGGGNSWARLESNCQITALLPHESGPFLYRVRSEIENFERVVAEIDLVSLRD